VLNQQLIDFIGSKAAGLINQHHWDVIANGVSQAIGFANELVFFGIQMQSAFA